MKSTHSKPGSDALAEYRATVEAALEAEVRDSAQVVGLLRTATPWSAWPEALRRALMAAVTEEGDGMEAQKARWLRGQLFRDTDPGWPSVLPSTLSPAEQGLAERLREDLLGRTALGCGKYLVPD
ncbi:MAG: hypothetical protein HC808_16760 [Candidatus Competibacteraceae bacterium]|nr:hypothetical protein [Candidatus Competibacteraceae bacterium]